MKQNIKLFPNVDYQDECNSIVDRAKKLLMEKKDKAYTDNPNITPEEIDRIRIKPFASNGKFSINETIEKGKEYTWNVWISVDKQGKLNMSVEIKDVWVNPNPRPKPVENDNDFQTCERNRMEKQKNNRKSYSKRWYRDNAKTLKEKRNKKLSEMTDEERNSLKQKQKKYYIDNKDRINKSNKKRYDEVKKKLKKLEKLEKLVDKGE